MPNGTSDRPPSADTERIENLTLMILEWMQANDAPEHLCDALSLIVESAGGPLWPFERDDDA